MSDYLGRLAAAASREDELAPAMRSRSPIAEFDQRIALPGFDALAGAGADHGADHEARGSAAPDLAAPGGPAPLSPAAVTARAPSSHIQRRALPAPSRGPPTSAPPSAPASSSALRAAPASLGRPASPEEVPAGAAPRRLSPTVEITTRPTTPTQAGADRPSGSWPIADAEGSDGAERLAPLQPAGDSPSLRARPSVVSDGFGSPGPALPSEGHAEAVAVRPSQENPEVGFAGARLTPAAPEPHGLQPRERAPDFPPPPRPADPPRVVIGHLDIEVVPSAPPAETGSAGAAPRPLTAAAISQIGPLGSGIRSNQLLSLRQR